jgi:peptide/nickel transport system substrate-binding protein
VVDDKTIEVVCADSCPILPSSLVGVTFQTPKWYQNTPADERDRTTVGFGSYRLAGSIDEAYVPGQFLKVTRYDDYVPVPGVPDMQPGTIRDFTYVWRTETNVRAAMINTREADWTYLLNTEDIPNLPKAQVVPQWEMEGFFIDTLWHPMLKQKESRQALVHAINCQELVEALFAGSTPCTTVPGVPGMAGVTEEVNTWWEYNPGLSRSFYRKQAIRGSPYESLAVKDGFPSSWKCTRPLWVLARCGDQR